MRFELMAFSFGGRRSNPLSYEALQEKFTRNCAGCQVKPNSEAERLGRVVRPSGEAEWLGRVVKPSG